MIILGIILIILNGMDVITTNILLKNPNMKERNPLKKTRYIKLFTCILALFLLSIFSNILLNTVIIICNLIVMVPVINNTVLLINDVNDK